jgi:hypothetical protein
MQPLALAMILIGLGRLVPGLCSSVARRAGGLRSAGHADGIFD